MKTRAEEALRRLSSCRLCPRNCGSNRWEGETGYCRTGRFARVASFGPHFGEEPELVGKSGSGTIFFCGCNLRCVFCQNYSISQLDEGRETPAAALAEIMLSLQKQGCHNLNLVSPSHVVPQILEALAAARARGLDLPLVYNSGGYDRVETLRLLDGVIDIYLPDAKYADTEISGELSDAADYPQVMRAALKEMHRQVGDLVMDERGTARRGLMIRHLVLPHDLAGTKSILAFITREISVDSYVNVMAQYRPYGKGMEDLRINRALSRDEYRDAVEEAGKLGLHRGFTP